MAASGFRHGFVDLIVSLVLVNVAIAFEIEMRVASAVAITLRVTATYLSLPNYVASFLYLKRRGSSSAMPNRSRRWCS